MTSVWVVTKRIYKTTANERGHHELSYAYAHKVFENKVDAKKYVENRRPRLFVDGHPTMDYICNRLKLQREGWFN